MKFIRNRKDFLYQLDEALKDELSPIQISKVKEVWGEDLLKYESADLTEHIQTGKFQLSDAEKISVFNKILSTNIERVVEYLTSVKFVKYYSFLKKSYETTGQDPESEILESFEKFDGQKIEYLFICSLFLKKFKVPNIKETLEETIILRDEKGIPIKDIDGKIQKIKKSDEQKDKIIFTNNLTDAGSLIYYYNQLCADSDVIEDEKFLSQRMFTSIYSYYNDHVIKGNFKLYPYPGMSIYITKKPTDVLNISVSKFFSSCQDLYGHESYKKQLIGNIFDQNSAPAFLIIDEPYYDSTGEKLVDFMPICRLMIRAIFDYTENEFKGLYFDRTYPERMADTLKNLIEKYFPLNIDSSYEIERKGLEYEFVYDLPYDQEIKDPYLDRISDRGRRRILGKNAKNLIISNTTKLVFSAKSNIETLTIKTSDLIESDIEEVINHSKNCKSLKFESIKLIKTTEKLKNLIMNNKIIEFNKCIIEDQFIEDISDIEFEDFKIISCSINSSKLELIKTKKLTILYSPAILSTDILSNVSEFYYSIDVYSRNKELIDSLKIKHKKIGI